MDTNLLKKKKKTTKRNKGLYTFEIFLISGPMDQEFLDRNPVISRTIEIRAQQTLKQLHRAIFKAFDREEEHMYEFQIGGKGPMDPDAKCYTSDEAGIDSTIASLSLKKDQAFGYWFDFGDDWWHQVNVISVNGEIPKGLRYPKIIKKIGDSPPQYEV